MRNARISRHVLRRLTALASGAALALGLIATAAPAQAAASNAEITVDRWLVGSSNAVTVSWTNGTPAISSVMVRSPWPWGATWSSADNASATGGITGAARTQTLTCPKGIVFTISSAALTSAPTCRFRNEANWKGFYIDGGGLSVGTSTSISVTIPEGLVVAPSSPQTDTWLVGVYDNSYLQGTQAEVATTAYAPASGDAPIVTIDFDANGGTCKTAKATGYATTWAKAPDANDCYRWDASFIGWNTSADGSGTGIAPGGWINFTSDNRVYAQYASYRLAGAPTNVTAVPGRNQVKVSWQAPADPGSSPIMNYLAQATPSGKVCITTATGAEALSCSFSLPATNTKYEFKVQALNPVGWGAFSAASNAVSPFDLFVDTVERPKSGFLDTLRGFGSSVTLEGRAPGVAPGTPVTPEWKAGNGAWVSETGAGVKVGAQGQVVWSKKLKRSLNGQPVSVRYAIGSERSAEYTVAVGSSAGRPSAPRNVKVVSTISGITVSWDAPARDGASPIAGYQMKSTLPGFACSTEPDVRTCTQRVRSVDPSMTYEFSVTARNASGTSTPATVNWRGEAYSLRYGGVGRRTFPDGAELSLDVVWGNGFAAGQGLVVETRIGEGRWRKQPERLVLANGGSGEWTGILAGAKRSDDISIRVVTPHGTTSPVIFKRR